MPVGEQSGKSQSQRQWRKLTASDSKTNCLSLLGLIKSKTISLKVPYGYFENEVIKSAVLSDSLFKFLPTFFLKPRNLLQNLKYRGNSEAFVFKFHSNQLYEFLDDKIYLTVSRTFQFRGNSERSRLSFCCLFPIEEELFLMKSRFRRMLMFF